MKRYVVFVFVVFIAIWAFSIALFSGDLSFSWLPEMLRQMVTASSFADLGNAMTTLDGLFSSIAIILGLIAILFQGKELKASTDAQTLQAEALSKQIAQQEASNRLGAYSARLQFLSAEIEHMETRIPNMLARAEQVKQKGDDAEEVSKQWDLIKNTRAKIERYRKQANAIDEYIQSLLEETSNKRK